MNYITYNQVDKIISRPYWTKERNSKSFMSRTYLKKIKMVKQSSKKHLSAPEGSRMLEELSQLKIYGGRSIEAQKLVMGNCKSVCVGR